MDSGIGCLIGVFLSAEKDNDNRVCRYTRHRTRVYGWRHVWHVIRGRIQRQSVLCGCQWLCTVVGVAILSTTSTTFAY